MSAEPRKIEQPTNGLSATDVATMVARVAAGSEQRERERVLPVDAVDVVRRARFGAYRVAREAGGGGATQRGLFSAVIDLAEADCNVAHLLRNHFLFVEQLLLNPDEQARRRWSPHVVAGEIFNTAGGEARAVPLGSPEFYAFATRLTEDGDGFRLTGSKNYTTGTLYSDWVSVLATREGHGIVSPTVPVAREGVEVLDDWDGMGQRLTASGTTRFDNVRVEADEILVGWAVEDGTIPPSYFTSFCQLWLHAVVAGILRSVVSDAARLLHTRTRSFSHAPTVTATADPLLLEVVGRIASTAYAAEAMVLAAADTIDVAYDSAVGGACDPDAVAEVQLRVSEVKVHLDELATDAATALFDVAAASATSQQLNLDRHWRNIRTLISHNPASYKAQAVGAHLVNATAFPENGYF